MIARWRRWRTYRREYRKLVQQPDLHHHGPQGYHVSAWHLARCREIARTRAGYPPERDS